MCLIRHNIFTILPFIVLEIRMHYIYLFIYVGVCVLVDNVHQHAVLYSHFYYMTAGD